MAYIGNAPADRFTSIPTVQQFNGDGSTTAFTLSRPVGTDQDLLVSVDGVIQDTAAYAVSNGTTLTFSAAPSTGTANIFVNYLGVTIGSVVHPASSALAATTGTFSDGVTITVDDNSDTLTLTSTDADANSGPNLRLYRNAGSPAAGDNLGQIDFEGRNDNSQDVVYASMKAKARDETDGTEDGGFQIDVMQDGTLRSIMKYYSDGSTQELGFNDDSIDVDFRVESNGNTHMLFVDGGNDKVGIGTSSPDAIFTVDTNVGGSSTGTIARFHSSKGESDSTYLQIAATRHGTASVQRVQLQAFDDDGSTGRTLALNPSGGNVGVGTNTPEATFAVTSAAEPIAKFHQTATGDVSAVILQHGRAASSTSAQMVAFLNGAGSAVGSINLTGSATAYATSSDYRLKENISDMTGATARLKQLKPKRFNWIADSDNTVQDGFLAHEVSSVVPEAVFGTKDAEIQKNGIGYQSLDHSKLVPLLVKTIQELEARIIALEG